MDANDLWSAFKNELLSRQPTHPVTAAIRSNGVKCARIENHTVHIVTRWDAIANELNTWALPILNGLKTLDPDIKNVEIAKDDSFWADEIAQQEREAEERRRKSTEERRRQEFSAAVEASNIPWYTRDTLRFNTFQQTDGNKRAYQLAIEYAFVVEDEPTIERHHFMTFMGKSGTGKTHLAMAIGWEYLEGNGHVLYFQVERLLDTLRGSFNRQNYRDGEPSYDKLMQQLQKVDLLILDDIGAQKDTDWGTAKLDVLVDYRYINESSTVFTTNETMVDKLGMRIASRISEGNMVKLATPDYRVIKAQRREKKSYSKEVSK